MNDRLPPRGEPPLIERARRIGWALLACALAAMLCARFGPERWSAAAIAVGVALSLLGLLAVVNVALVRGLYKQIDAAAPPGEGGGSAE